MNIIIDTVVKEYDNVTIDIDGYVPIDIKLVDSKGNPPLYWRVGDGSKSLLELAVLPENGFLSAITLVMMDANSIHKVGNNQVELSCEESGLPIVNLDLWKDSANNDFSQRFIDNFNCDMQVYISEDTILIKIIESDNVNWIHCGGGFYLGLNEEKNITHLLINSLTQVDITNFTESVC
ncbi:hypothetical protein FHU10_3741 [Serratia fonticola]|uniref:Uncharacterized protein n=1 Tax=Serratia fonticola TaxID=47917 RepID=A0A542D0N3_SERFO|nr:hypothetical protein [Serratia fonticola]TQI81344.1 hypothetical protein FHU09_3966 [Serratia fonticola]TQI96632.1 hypothetical protein FHU11_2080 [Serratia fonticola]TVZ71128.1 hypothetical protein FHU10_3741 [Serratia fonticola]